AVTGAASINYVDRIQMGPDDQTDTARLYGSIRWVVWVIWLAVGLDELIKLTLAHAAFFGYPALPWLAIYCAFAGALWLSDSLGRPRANSRFRSVTALVTAETCTFSLLYLQPQCNADSFVLVLAWQAALVLPRRWAVAWVLVQTALVVLVERTISRQDATSLGLAAVYWSIQTFALAAALVARREARISQELSHNNAELKATQLMLARAGQVGERVRIARELHDSLGHDLTALGLHLEVALHSPGRASQDLRQARTIASGLLSRVREAVSLLRDNESTRLAPILYSLMTDSPGLKIHLAISDDIDVTDAQRAHALMRCLQEFITNARRHSGANNLWLDVKRDGNNLVAIAKDDGRGAAPELLREESAALKSGEGLRGARERLEQCGGRLIVETAVDKGFLLEATLPLGAGS
ncbi:MAG TPA: histidine kinase, partial [Chthonomonadales bacterium]|nr:histidine kinase [Chthonomonadales bacterium]